MIGSSLLMASFGFMVHSISPAFADNSKNPNLNSNYKLIPTNPDGSINVRFSPTETMKIDLSKVGGRNVACFDMTDRGGNISSGIFVNVKN
jgi:hypothetical protein